MNPVEDPTTGVVALLLDDLAAPRLGTLLRGARKQRALTRRDVAFRVGTTSSAIRRYERGDAPVPPRLVAELAECYGDDLTSQFATRIPIEVDRHHIVVGAEEASLDSGDDDEVLGTYVGIVARLRHAKPGEPIGLRTNDLVALSTALGKAPEHIEARIVELLGCTPSEARSLHSELLRRKLVLPVAGLVAGLAVIAGIGIATATPGGSAAHEAGPPQLAGPAPAHHIEAPMTTVVARTVPEPKAEPIAAQPTATPRVADAAEIGVAGLTAPGPTTSIAAPVPSTTEMQPAATVPRPVITTDTTPMSIPPNEHVTITSP